MKYPSIILKGDNAHGETLTMALADSGQNLDTGAKMFHIGKNTTSLIKSKTISKGSGVATYRGISKISSFADNSRAKVDCQGLLLDPGSKSYAYPVDTNASTSSIIEHEASISRVSQDQLFYLQSRGISEDAATKLIVSGFIEPIVAQLPMEYSVELERLLELSMQKTNGKD